MYLFWAGLLLGVAVCLAAIVFLASTAQREESDAQRVAREVREAKQQIDHLFTETRSKMAAAEAVSEDVEHEPDEALRALRETFRRSQ